MPDAGTYGDGLAPIYDRLFPQAPDADYAAQFVRDLAPHRRVLELGVGSGRLSRYAWPSEPDLMARLAGLRLRDRFGGWLREPVTEHPLRHVFVFEVEHVDN